MKELTEEQKMNNIRMVLAELKAMTENQMALRKPKPDTFKEALTDAINIYSQENGSDTPDYILAEYLIDCLAKFNKAVNDREVHYGRLKNGVPGEMPEGWVEVNQRLCNICKKPQGRVHRKCEGVK